MTIRFSNGTTQDLRVIYEEIFSYLDVISMDETDKATFVNHILRQPFRNQYRLLSVYDDFLRDNSQLSDEEKKIALTDKLLKVFEVYINQYAADNKHLMAKTSMYAGWIMKFLIDNKIVATGSHMMPNMEDDSLNNAILALCTSCTRQIHTNPSIAFDFLVRVSFIRQVLLSLGEDGSKLNDFAHIYYDSGISKLLGNVLAYVNAEMNMIPSIRPESNLQNTMAGVFAINKDLVPQNGVKGLLVRLIQLRTISSDMSETKFCSIYRLFAAIAEILRVTENINVEKDENGEKRKTVIKAKLLHLAQVHTYIEPNDLKPGNKLRDKVGTQMKFNIEDASTVIDDYVEVLWKWISKYSQVDKLTPYNLDRIFTRMYYTFNDITPNGTVNESAEMREYISNYILAFWNACIVEDCIVNGEVKGIELGHDGKIVDIFMYNYWKRFLEKHQEKNSFAKWMISCPLLQSYVASRVLKFVDKIEEKEDVPEAVVKEYVESNQLDFLLSQQIALAEQKDTLEAKKEENLKNQIVLKAERDNLDNLFDKEVEIQNITNELAKKSVPLTKRGQLAKQLNALRKEKRSFEDLAFEDEDTIAEKLRSLKFSQRFILRELSRLNRKDLEISKQIDALKSNSSKLFQDVNQTEDYPYYVFLEFSK